MAAATIQPSTIDARAHLAFGRLDNARGPRVSTRSRVNRSDGEDGLWHVIILHSLHMAVIGDVNSEALYPASDPFRSTP